MSATVFKADRCAILLAKKYHGLVQQNISYRIRGDFVVKRCNVPAISQHDVGDGKGIDDDAPDGE